MGTKLFVTVNEAKDAVTVQINDVSGRALAHSILDPSATDALIGHLGKARGILVERVVDSLDPGSRVETELMPAWNIPTTHSGPATVLLNLRHSGFGWLGFALEAESAKQMGQMLIGLANELSAKQ